jgi:hypothetical protein
MNKVTVQIYLDGPREIESPLHPDWESLTQEERRSFFRALQDSLISSTVAFIIDYGQAEDL